MVGPAIPLRSSLGWSTGGIRLIDVLVAAASGGCGSVEMVGPARFELATSCTPSKRASQAALRPDKTRSLPFHPKPDNFHLGDRGLQLLAVQELPALAADHPPRNLVAPPFLPHRLRAPHRLHRPLHHHAGDHPVSHLHLLIHLE